MQTLPGDWPRSIWKKNKTYNSGHIQSKTDWPFSNGLQEELFVTLVFIERCFHAWNAFRLLKKSDSLDLHIYDYETKGISGLSSMHLKNFLLCTFKSTCKAWSHLHNMFCDHTPYIVTLLIKQGEKESYYINNFHKFTKRNNINHIPLKEQIS